MNATTENTLPELDDGRIAAMERTVFAHIGRERATRTTRRRRWWIAGVSAAAVVVVAAVIAPTVVNSVSPMATTLEGAASDQPLRVIEGVPFDAGPESAVDAAQAASGGSADAAAVGARETISTASATVVVGDVRAAADAIAAAADARGGYVESVSVGSEGVSPAQVEPAMPYPGVGDGWITVRVPADELTDVVAELSEVGQVSTSSVSAQDVTDQAIDLRARIAAAETSVQRLTELLAQSQSTADLIAAESALQERQATLDSDRQQLASLEGQVQLATLSVQLTRESTPVEADPAGFGDGVLAGWNGLVATLNGIVIAFGFLLPWIAVLAVLGAIVWGVAAAVRRARRRPTRRVDEEDVE